MLFRSVIRPALEKSEKECVPVISLKLSKNKIITGKQTSLLTASSSVILNAIKELSRIPDDIDLLSPKVIEPILKMKKDLNLGCERLQLNEVLTALSICSATNPMVELAIEKLKKLKYCEAHSTYMVNNGDLKALKSLKINITCEPKFLSEIE